jgi:uncharacterized delta-60 repeat protein
LINLHLLIANNMKKTNLILTIFIMAISLGAFAQDGDLDLTFDTDGIVITAIDSNNIGRDIVVQPDGKIIVGGYTVHGTDGTDFALARYNTNGSPDSSFSEDGQLRTHIGNFGSIDRILSIALQSDGKIVAVGYTNSNTTGDFALARYNADGSLDSSFSSDGLLIHEIGYYDEAHSVAINPSGKIVVAGYTYGQGVPKFIVAQYNPNGTPDSSFSADGLVTISIGVINNEAEAVALQSDGKIVVAGLSDYKFSLVRYNTDGSLDTSFSSDGKLTTSIGDTTDYAYAIAIQSDGKIVVAGSAATLINSILKRDFALARYNTDGSLDSSFSMDGKVITAIDTINHDGSNSVVLQADGKIVAAGYSNDGLNNHFALVRYNPNGSLDNSFGSDGHLTTAIGTGESNAFSVAIQADGKIIAAGFMEEASYKFAVARYTSTLNVGIIDFTLAESILVYPNPIESSETLEYTLKQDENITIELYAISGRLIKSFVAMENRKSGMHKESLNFGDIISPANYFLTITNGRGSFCVKVTKQ